MKGKLVLDDGSVLDGELFGSEKTVIGRLVFDTRVVGYEEVLTDPSYFKIIVCFTYPLIGNYGINYEDSLSDTGYCGGLIVNELSRIYSNFRAKVSLEEFLNEKEICMISKIDTQYITRKVRENGDIWASVVPSGEEVEIIKKKLKEEKEKFPHSDLVKDIVDEKLFCSGTERCQIAVLNLGVNKKEISSLESTGYSIKVFSLESSYEKIIKNSSALYVSSGPESFPVLKYGSEFVKNFIGKIPVFGAGLGHLIIGIALGGKISANVVNHYGANQPVKEIKSKKSFMTEQSHSFILNKESTAGKIGCFNLNDGTVEGLESDELKVFSVSFKPQDFHFKKFFQMIK